MEPCYALITYKDPTSAGNHTYVIKTPTLDHAAEAVVRWLKYYAPDEAARYVVTLARESDLTDYERATVANLT